MWQHLQHCSPGGLFAKLQLLCLQTVCFMHNNAVYGYNGTKVIVELLQLISYSSRKRKYLYFAHWSAQRPKRVFGNVPRSLSLSYALFPQHSRASKIKITTKAHTQRELQRKWWLLSARTRDRERVMGGRTRAIRTRTCKVSERFEREPNVATMRLILFPFAASNGRFRQFCGGRQKARTCERVVKRSTKQNNNSNNTNKRKTKRIRKSENAVYCIVLWQSAAFFASACVCVFSVF